MLYIQYVEFKTKYYEAQKRYDEILSEKELMFVQTQPKATQYDKEVVTGGVPANTFDNYLIEKDKKQIDERLNEAKSILEDRERLLKGKEAELKESKNWFDIIYVYAFIYRLSVRKIEKRVPFGKSEIDRKLQIIKNNLKSGQNGTKGMLL